MKLQEFWVKFYPADNSKIVMASNNGHEYLWLRKTDEWMYLADEIPHTILIINPLIKHYGFSSSLRNQLNSRADGIPAEDFVSSLGERVGCQHACLCHSELYGCFKTAQPVLDASNQVNGRCLRKIFCRTTHLCNGVAEPDNLCQHLVIKYKIIGVDVKGQFLQQTS